MPELPEVEAVRVGLSSLIIGETIQSVDIRWPRIVAQPRDSMQFARMLKGESFEAVRRRGKYLIFDLTHYSLVSHLRMEGKYRLLDQEQTLDKHDHVIFHLESGKDLRYNDVRKFGRMSLIKKQADNNFLAIQKLGPEPTAENLKSEPFYQAIKKHKKSIKAVLLDQSAVAGLGNIYCDEVLFRARIHPASSANHLNRCEIENLRQIVISLMAEAVAAGGTTIRTYKNAFGEVGHFQHALKVYGHRGDPCPRCGTRIEKISVSQRGTHFCPKCQLLKE